jgi:surfactin synthase thioesterase subunit
MYRQWPAEYDGVNFCPVQLPGRENRLSEPPFPTYQDLADVLADELLPFLDRPFGLFGHCSSALAAYETALRLAQRGHPVPGRLYVSSEVAPQDGPYGRYLDMEDAALADEVTRLMVSMGGTPLPGFIDMTLRVLRHDVEVNRRYHVADPPALPCPITVVGWTGDVGMEPRRLTGWSACGETTEVVLDGDHYQFVQAPEPLLRLLADGVGARV